MWEGTRMTPVGSGWGGVTGARVGSDAGGFGKGVQLHPFFSPDSRAINSALWADNLARRSGPMTPVGASTRRRPPSPLSETPRADSQESRLGAVIVRTPPARCPRRD